MNSTSSKRIHFLSEQLANQIAAGEVVERPASVLKELLENALDAGATQIDVEVEKGGTVSLSVRDNGHGIHQEDMALAISRHATSKIDSLADLEALFSLGFRGEALASIGSVSRMKLVSRTVDSEHAWSIAAEGRDSVPQQSPATHPVGTTIQVRELFFNTPARRRFLRSEKTEFNHLDDVFKRAALSRPEVSFSLSHNQRPVHRYRARTTEQSQQRVIDVCGKAFASELQQVEQEMDEVSLRGWVSSAKEGRSSTDLQYFFLNGRMVRDKLIQHAIRQAYESILPPGRHAAYVLYMDIPPTAVDVNVHPTKHEVRFQQARKIHDFVVVALRRHLPKIETAMSNTGTIVTDMAEPTATSYQVRKPLMPAYAEPHMYAVTTIPRANISPTTGNDEQRLLSTIGSRYLLIEMGEEIRILDMHKVDALLLEQQLSSLYDSTSPVSPLIFPVQIPLSPMQMSLLESLRERFSLLQFKWDYVDEQRIRINHAPEYLQHMDLQSWLSALLNLLLEDAEDTPDIQRLIELMARTAMGRRRYPLNQTELNALLVELKGLAAELLESASLWLSLDAELVGRLMGVADES
ncbi:MAG: DNA mismatch repair endonuclease MutL [Gammaproteobacteria bacterium]|nr:DNA mismatch repair endonuclease MutL [Gammaproteobacteria bacterium]